MQLRADVIEQMYQPKELIGVTEQEIIWDHIAITNIMKQK
jgi:hypothetical protein